MSNVKVIEKNDQRVLTTAQLAESYGTDYKSISKNYTRNAKRYQEGKHYFLLKGEERHEFLDNYRQIDDSLKHAKHIFLWTVQGALLHAKSLNTDQAWEAYSALVDDYFRKADQLQRANIPSQPPQEIEDILIMSLQAQKELKQEVNRLRLVVDNEIFLTDHQKADIQDAVIERTHALRRKGYDAHYQSIYRALKAHFSVPKYDKILRKDFDDAMDLIKGWYPKKKEEA
jgi:hypothetical protein